MYRPGNMSLELMKKLVKEGITIANDFIHTAMAPDYKWPVSREEMWRVLFDFTEETAESTDLLHVNTLLPPYNGTDSHDGITDGDFKRRVFPNRDQLKRLLSLFKDRDDVYLIPEPKENMRENHLALKKILSEL
jgi:hypothetical protein